MKDNVVRFTHECFRLCHIPHGINITFIVLVPKTKHSINFNHFRPISLCNFVYKIISKILTKKNEKFDE